MSVEEEALRELCESTSIQTYMMSFEKYALQNVHEQFKDEDMRGVEVSVEEQALKEVEM